MIISGNQVDGIALRSKAQALIKTMGKRLQIKDEKSSIIVFENASTKVSHRLVEGTQGKNGLEYLGFRFDGRRAYIRDSTLSNLYRKIARSARREAIALAKRYPDKNATELRPMFNDERLISRFGRVENFDEIGDEYRNWTFWTYARRAASLFGTLGKPILRQLKDHRNNIRSRINFEVERAVARR